MLLKTHTQYFIFFKDFINLFMRATERERGRDTGRGRNRLHAGSPMWDSILEFGSRPEPKADTQLLSHQGSLVCSIIYNSQITEAAQMSIYR